MMLHSCVWLLFGVMSDALEGSCPFEDSSFLQTKNVMKPFDEALVPLLHVTVGDTASESKTVSSEDFHVSLEESGDLLVRFTQGDDRHEWSLQSRSVYTEKATRIAYSGDTPEVVGASLHMYAGRSASGTARAVLHEDGRISGTFVTEGGLMRVTPAELEDSQPHGGAEHLVEQLGLPSLFGNESVTENTWSGQPWSPGCFSCDDVMHEFLLGVVNDVI